MIAGLRLIVLGCSALGLLALARAASGAQTTPNVRLLELRRIWDRARHNAFTDLIRFKGHWYCAFREGKSHVCDTGRLRVITSPDGQEWTSAALMAWDGGDVRDAKLSIAADGRLMLSGAVRFLKPVEGQTHQSVSWLSADGKQWDGPFRIGDPNLWMWSATWYKSTGYSIGYSTAGRRFIRLYHTRDGEKWTTLADDIFPGGTYANETSLVFAPDDTCYCLLRRDSQEATAQLGTAKPPYTKWAWKDLGVRVGGPKMIQLPDGRFLATVRLYDEKVRTGVCWIDAEAGRLHEILTLPSGGDTSYAGMVLHEGLLWVSYYSSHERKTSIYLAKLRIVPTGP
jgi:hypothetical protein